MEWLRALWPLNVEAAVVGATLSYEGVPYVCTFTDGVHVYCDLIVLATSPTSVSFKNGSYIRQDGGKMMMRPYRLILIDSQGNVESYQQV